MYWYKEVFLEFKKNRHLIYELSKREVIGRYKGSYLGVLWSLIIPILMLIVYTFVFSVVFKGKWGVESHNKVEFALIIFAGITIFNIFAEVINRAPSLILSNVNYVKKVVFPLEILPVVSVISALINALISILILLVGIFVSYGAIPFTVFYLPFVLLPVILLSLGFGWFLSSLGVYIRDLNHFTGIAVSALMFLSPIFYSVSAVPVELRWLFYLNPMSYVVEDMRKIMIWGQLPDWGWLGIGGLISFVICESGFLWFQKTRGGFADVL